MRREASFLGGDHWPAVLLRETEIEGDREGGQGSQQAPRSWERGTEGGSRRRRLTSPFSQGAGEEFILSLLLPLLPNFPLLPLPPPPSLLSFSPSSPLLSSPSPSSPPPPPWPPQLTAPRSLGQCSGAAVWPLLSPRIQDLLMVGQWEAHFHVAKTQLQKNHLTPLNEVEMAQNFQHLSCSWVYSPWEIVGGR